MARNTSNQRDQSTSKSSDQSVAKPMSSNRDAKGSTNMGTRADPADRERSIPTDREATGSTGLTRQPVSSPVYGASKSPFLAMQRMAEDMDHLFESVGFGRAGFGISPFLAGSSLQQFPWTPQVETFRRGDKLIVRADLPGMSKDDVNVQIEDGLLTISGERCEESEEDRDDFYRSERRYGQFSRAIPLPDGVSDAHCEASFKDGVLEVSLVAPRKEERKARRVQIR
jgi:HSP20 family protein